MCVCVCVCVCWFLGSSVASSRHGQCDGGKFERPRPAASYGCQLEVLLSSDLVATFCPLRTPGRLAWQVRLWGSSTAEHVTHVFCLVSMFATYSSRELQQYSLYRAALQVVLMQCATSSGQNIVEIVLATMRVSTRSWEYRTRGGAASSLVIKLGPRHSLGVDSPAAVCARSSGASSGSSCMVSRVWSELYSTVDVAMSSAQGARRYRSRGHS